MEDAPGAGDFSLNDLLGDDGEASASVSMLTGDFGKQFLTLSELGVDGLQS